MIADNASCIRTFHLRPDEEVNTWDRSSPDWRYRRAEEVANRDCHCILDYDATVWAIVDHFGGLPSERRHQLTQGCSLDWPNLTRIRNDHITRLTVESRLLAYRNIGIVSHLHGYPEQLLKQYCAIFFDLKTITNCTL